MRVAAGRTLLAASLLVVALIVYRPAWHGAVLWDDDAHLTAPVLQSWEGLRRIWFDIGATQQYYPVTHSAFWVQNALWGQQTLGYHIVNIGLHALCGWLLAQILVRMNIRGAWFAALVFVVHPVHVESVAWMSELKNTLSGALGLGAMLLLHQATRSDHVPVRQTASLTIRSARGLYALALMLFVLALLAKTTVAVLPAAFLVVAWWQRGTLAWHRDVRPVVPFLVLGMAGGVLTAYVEHTLIIGTAQSMPALGPVERVLVAGRAFWFYLGAQIWPANLSFIYPQWTIDASVWWQWVFPAGIAAMLAASWRMAGGARFAPPTSTRRSNLPNVPATRGRQARAPLALLLLFGGLLFPALGFVDIYPFRFTFVADHFQYLASMATITAFAAVGRGRDEQAGRPPGRSAKVSDRRWRERGAGRLFDCALVLVLAVLTWQQAGLYLNAETLYRETLNRNPGCWLCANNLGVLHPPERSEEALALFKEAIRLNPGYAEAYNNIGVVLQERGDLPAAIAEYRQALAHEPNYPSAQRNLALALATYAQVDGRGDVAEEARHRLADALRHYPHEPALHYNLGLALASTDPVHALECFLQAIRLNPDLAEAHNGAGNVLLFLGRDDDAIVRYRESLRLKPDFADAHFNLGNAYLNRGRSEEAMAQYREALRFNPNLAEPHNAIGSLLRREGRVAEAIAYFRTALRLNPMFGAAAFNLGNALYESRQPAAAAQAFRQALAAQPDDAESHNNLGLALEMLGDTAGAAVAYREALRFNPHLVAAQANLDRTGRR